MPERMLANPDDLNARFGHRICTVRCEATLNELIGLQVNPIHSSSIAKAHSVKFHGNGVAQPTGVYFVDKPEP